jgi:DNA-binding transcriptional LysR family regulator
MLLRRRAEDILDMVDKTAEEFKALGEISGGDIHIGCAESDGIRHWPGGSRLCRHSTPVSVCICTAVAGAI